MVVAAVFTGMFIVAVLLVVFIEVVLHGVAITTQGSLNMGGRTAWTIGELLAAVTTHPSLPDIEIRRSDLEQFDDAVRESRRRSLARRAT